MKRKGLDNFKTWREEQKREGYIKSTYGKFHRDGDLAELIGVVLGDGHIEKFPRTEALYVLSNSNNKGFVIRYAGLIKTIFEKKPHVSKLKSSNCIRIRIYEKHISSRLNIPTGARKNTKLTIPLWISKRRTYLIRYLRGLYEAEGSYNIHAPTYTHKFIFSNRNISLLSCVEIGVRKLGFHPHQSSDKIQISRKDEVEELRTLLHFREY